MPIYALDGISPQFDDSDSIWIAPDATVIGKVVLGRETGIWFGAVLRGDNETISIGPGSNVQEHCVLHTDPGFPLAVGEGCTIGHRAILHGCTIGDNSLIGMSDDGHRQAEHEHVQAALGVAAEVRHARADHDEAVRRWVMQLVASADLRSETVAHQDHGSIRHLGSCLGDGIGDPLHLVGVAPVVAARSDRLTAFKSGVRQGLGVPALRLECCDKWTVERRRYGHGRRNQDDGRSHAPIMTVALSGSPRMSIRPPG